MREGMPRRYYHTTTIKRRGSALHVYIPSSWGFQRSQPVVFMVDYADRTDLRYKLRSYIRNANSTGSLMVTIPKRLGMSAGEWVTFAIEAEEDDSGRQAQEGDAQLA